MKLISERQKPLIHGLKSLVELIACLIYQVDRVLDILLFLLIVLILIMYAEVKEVLQAFKNPRVLIIFIIVVLEISIGLHGLWWRIIIILMRWRWHPSHSSVSERVPWILTTPKRKEGVSIEEHRIYEVIGLNILTLTRFCLLKESISIHHILNLTLYPVIGSVNVVLSTLLHIYCPGLSGSFLHTTDEDVDELLKKALGGPPPPPPPLNLISDYCC
jgi:hypothetical protein